VISLLLSNASRKAWVSGLVAALLTPVLDLLEANGEITLRTLGVSILGGLLSAAAVFGTTNTPPGPVTEEDLPGEHAAR
jgi:hypothetical protein